MIVAVCADKGAPGVTDLATVLALVWPGRRVLLEADGAGADLPFRVRHADGDRLLDAQPSVLTLAAAARGTLPDGGLARYSQPTTLGVPVVPGALSAEGFGAMARLWPQVAQAAAGWDGTVIADLGRCQPGCVAAPLTAAATAVLVLARPDLAGLYHLRDRIGELASTLGDPAAARSPVAVVVRAAPGSAGRRAVEQVRQVLAAAGSPVPVLGPFAEDPAGIGLLRDGDLSRRLLGSELVRSARALTGTVLSCWPQLTGTTHAAPDGPGEPAAGCESPGPTPAVAGRPGRWRTVRRAPAASAASVSAVGAGAGSEPALEPGLGQVSA